MRHPRFVLWPTLVLADLTATGCAINPATGKNQLILVSEEQGIAMGRAADAPVIATIGPYPDDAWQRYIQQLGGRLAAISERPDLPWTFRVMDGSGGERLRRPRRLLLRDPRTPGQRARTGSVAARALRAGANSIHRPQRKPSCS